MDATTWADSEYANSGHDRVVTALRQANPSPTEAEMSVMILHADPVIAAGLAAVLHECARFRIIPAPQFCTLGFSSPQPDVVLADYDTALRLAESATTSAKNLLVFTSCDSEAKICRALENGVRGYLLHGIGLVELFDGIRSVYTGGVALSPQVAARITNRIKGQALTVRERAVLEQLMLGLSNKGIASRLNLCVGTVKTHVKSILEKLNANSRTAAVITAQRRGLLS